MSNNRIYYATEQVAIKGDATSYNFNDLDSVHGAQSAAIQTQFNLQQLFELGQQAIYENIEDLPDVTVTLNKVLDGYPLMYHKATVDAVDPTLAGRSNAKCIVGLAVYPDTNEASEGTPGTVVAMSGMYANSITYNFPLEDAFNEDVTLVGNNKIWAQPPTYGQTLNPNLPTPAFTGTSAFAGNDDEPIGQGGVNRRENMLFAVGTGLTLDANGQVKDPDCTILPMQVLGISSSGTQDLSDANRAKLSSITVSVDLGRTELNELGRKGPYHRVVDFPIEVTTDIEVTAHSGDMISATEDGIFTTGTACGDDLGNLLNSTIRIATCEGTRIYLGLKNKLASVNHSGGDTSGGNVTVTYSFSTFNDFTVLHSGDPHASGTTWWTNRSTYLLD